MITSHPYVENYKSKSHIFCFDLGHDSLARVRSTGDFSCFIIYIYIDENTKLRYSWWKKFCGIKIHSFNPIFRLYTLNDIKLMQIYDDVLPSQINIYYQFDEIKYSWKLIFKLMFVLKDENVKL